MSINRIMVWVSGQILYASDLNTEFNNTNMFAVNDTLTGQAKGDILVRNAGLNWVILPIGVVAGQFLGISSGMPAWASPDTGEGHITILPWNYSGITQGTWGWNTQASQLFAGTYYNSSNAQNDRIDYAVSLSAGTYSFILSFYATATGAILTLLLDGNSVGTIDTYSGSNQYNQRGTITGIAVSTTGLHTISFKAATRNGSATGWSLYVSSAGLFRTA